MDIFIDFDGTITDPDLDFAEAAQAPPQPGSVEAINKLYDAGYTISIYSCRSNPEVVGNIKRKMLTINPTELERQWVAQTLEDEMVAFLRIHKIKYHHIVKGKPHYHIIIDDRAFNPKQGWDNILKQIPN
jgi:histidinol phosphatase-like enzyme